MISRRTLLNTAGATAVLAGVPLFRVHAEDAPIKLGCIEDNSGVLDIYGKPIVMANALAVEEINAAGGLLGRKIELKQYDSQSDIALYTKYAQQLVREDKVDVAVLVPNCPVCHQTTALVARHLEANGIPTVVMGCAKDIVEHAAVPRFLFSDFPLGNSAGKPHDAASQALTLELALRLLEAAPGPQTTTQSPLRWSEDAAWKRDYNNVANMSAEELARRRAEFDAQKQRARSIRDTSAA